MSQINQPPFGLQALLGSKNFGDNPSVLAETVLPTVDLTMFLYAEKIFYERTASVLNARGQANSINVPAGELWLLLNATMRLEGANNVGTQWAGAIEIVSAPNQSTNPFQIATNDLRTTAVVGEIQALCYNSPFVRPIWSDSFISGRLAEYVPGGAPNNDTFSIHVEFVKLTV